VLVDFILDEALAVRHEPIRLANAPRTILLLDDLWHEQTSDSGDFSFLDLVRGRRDMNAARFFLLARGGFSR
jgi:hypothetical protein